MIIIFYNHKSYCIQLQSNLLLPSYVFSKALKCISIYKLINQYVKLMDKCKDISPNVSKERTIFELNLKVKEHIKFFYVLFEIKTIMKCSSYRRFEILQNKNYF